MSKKIEIIGYTPTEYQLNMHNILDNDQYNEYYFILSRQSGKTMFAINECLKRLINNHNYSVAYITPTYKLSKSIFRNIKKLLYDITIVKQYNETELIIFFKNGSTLQFYSAENQNALRGNTFDFVIIDEGAFIGDDFFDQIIKPTLLVKKGKSIVITTPKGRNWVYNKYMMGLSQNNKIYSLKKSIFDNTLITKEQIEDIQKTTPKHIFEMEYMCSFDVLDSVLFQNIENHIKKPDYIKNIHIGIDLGRVNDYSVVVAINNKGEMIDMLRINKNSWDFILEKIFDFIKKYYSNINSGFIEINNIGDVIAEKVTKQFPKINVFYTNSNKSKVIENLILNWDRNEVTILDDENVKNELSSFTLKWSSRSRNITYGAPSGLHDDIVIALALAHWSLKENKTKGKYTIA